MVVSKNKPIFAYSFTIKNSIMKKLLFAILVIIAVSSCTTTRQGGCPSKTGNEMGW